VEAGNNVNSCLVLEAEQQKLPLPFCLASIYAAFTQAGLTTSYQTKSLYKSIFRVVKVKLYVVYEEDRKPA